jgi:hypothetical protein
MAALLLSLKANFDVESLPSDADFAVQIRHLSKRTVEFQEVIAGELSIVEEFHSSLGAPTVLTFLESLGRKIAPTPVCRRLASFLVHLSLGDVDLHYGHPSLILAAAAWLLAMYATHDDDSMTLLPIIAHGFLDMAWLCLELRTCIVGLLELWSCSRKSQRQFICKGVCTKFAGRLLDAPRRKLHDDFSGQKFVAISRVDVFVGEDSLEVLTTVQKDSILEAMGCITITGSDDMLPVRTQHGLEGFVHAGELNHVLDDVLHLVPQWCWMRKWLEKRLGTIS